MSHATFLHTVQICMLYVQVYPCTHIAFKKILQQLHELVITPVHNTKIKTTWVKVYKYKL